MESFWFDRLTWAYELARRTSGRIFEPVKNWNFSLRRILSRVIQSNRIACIISFGNFSWTLCGRKRKKKFFSNFPLALNIFSFSLSSETLNSFNLMGFICDAALLCVSAGTCSAFNPTSRASLHAAITACPIATDIPDCVVSISRLSQLDYVITYNAITWVSLAFLLAAMSPNLF